MNNPIDLSGYHLSFDAEMTDASDMSSLINTFNNGDTTIASNHEAETYVSYGSSGGASTYSFSNGALNITANPIGNSGQYTSGMVSTGNSFYQNQGYFEMRAELPSGSGFWPAFWLLAGGPTDFSTEIDALEQPNNDGNSNYFNSIKTPTYNVGGFTNTGVDLSAGYHTYGFMWTATSVQFVFDGNYIGTAVATPAAMANLKMYLIANLAVGGSGSWPGVPANGASATMSIDYIRAYSNNPSVPTWYKVDQVSPADGAANTAPGVTSSVAAVPASIVVAPAPTAAQAPVTPAPVSGTNTLTIGVSEDALVGDAQFRVLVDGFIVGDVQTATASHSAGAISTATVTGSWGSGPHTVGIAFINAASDAAGNHRGLYVNSIASDGVLQAISPATLLANGTDNFAINPVAPASSGTSTLTIHAAADSSAQFALFIDGFQTTTPQTVTASNAQGGSQAFSVNVGQLSPGLHLAAIADLNPADSHNLYLKGAELNGASLSAANWTPTLNAGNSVLYTSFMS